MRNWLRDSANRPRTNSLCARSKATRAADSSWVGWRGVGVGAGAGRTGLTARTAATFCGFLTLEAADFFAAAFLTAALAGLGAGFGVGFLLLTTFLLTAFLAGFVLTAVFRVVLLAAVARLAFGFDAAFAFTVRFAVFAEVRFAADRADDRRKPFVRLLLILV